MLKSLKFIDYIIIIINKMLDLMTIIYKFWKFKKKIFFRTQNYNLLLYLKQQHNHGLLHHLHHY